MSTPILTDRKVSGASAGIQVTGETAIFARGVFDGATVEMECALTDIPSNYVPCGRPERDRASIAAFDSPGVIVVDVIPAAYWLRAVVLNAGPKTSITVESSYGA